VKRTSSAALFSLCLALGISANAQDVKVDRGAVIEAVIHQTEPDQVIAIELLKLRNQGRQPGDVIQAITLPKTTPR
jgi:hypothetical protein